MPLGEALGEGEGAALGVGGEALGEGVALGEGQAFGEGVVLLLAEEGEGPARPLPLSQSTRTA